MQQQERPPVYYSEYLQLDKILNAQQPESGKEGMAADDEMLFIIIHQAYELWFKQILFELDVVRKVFRQTTIPNSSPDIYNSVHRLKRICRILEIAVNQMTVMETMTPLDFLDFRDLLRPASGFQSIQFKMIEAALGLTYGARFGQNYYLSQLSEQDIERVKKAESEQSLLVLVNSWLERMPFIKDPKFWPAAEDAGFWRQYRKAYEASLREGEAGNLKTLDKLFIDEAAYPEGRSFSFDASRNALFIMLYRDYPLLHLPFELLSTLLEIDELLSLWRHRHIHMVQRTIGKRTGTGGSSGAEYLQKAADSHYIFKELAELTSFLLPRTMLPKLPAPLAKVMGFEQ
jgi:tryptophan 2,3-dioxygenase